MFPPRFAYYRPDSVDEALALLTQLGPDARVLAGGHSLIPLMKQRLVAPPALVDLQRITGLADVAQQDDSLAIGAMARHVYFETERFGPTWAILRDAASVIADPQVRHRGTVGGSLVEADPGGDWGPVMLALDAALECVGPDGARMIPAREWFVDAFTTAIAPGELLKSVRVTRSGGASGGAYVAFKRRAGDYAIASAAVYLSLREDGACARAGVGLGNVGLMPLKAKRAEQILLDSPLDEATIAAAATAAMEEAEPLPDLRGTEEYKRDVVRALVARAIKVALQRGKGEGAPLR